MNLKRIFGLVGAFAAVGAAAAACVVAAAFALYALLKVYLGAAGAAAGVAVVFALIAVIVALLATRRPGRHGSREEEASLPDQLFSMVKQRPLIALGAAAAGITVLVRNPAVVTALVSAFLAGNASKPRR